MPIKIRIKSNFSFLFGPFKKSRVNLIFSNYSNVRKKHEVHDEVVDNREGVNSDKRTTLEQPPPPPPPRFSFFLQSQVCSLIIHLFLASCFNRLIKAEQRSLDKFPRLILARRKITWPNFTRDNICQNKWILDKCNKICSLSI